MPATFSVTTKGFADPNGNAWTARGLDVDLSDALSNLRGIEQNYPGLTMIRLVCSGSTSTLAQIDPVVQAYTAKGIVVEIEDHADSDNGDNTAWYSMLATAYKNNPFVFLETPNEPPASEAGQDQINIIQAIRATGFANPIGIQSIGGWDQTAMPTVTAAVGTQNLYVTSHVYYDGTSPTASAVAVQQYIQRAAANGMFDVMDEFGNAEDGVDINPQGNTVITSVIAANEAGQAGALFWAAGNGYHPDGADSAFMNPTGSQLTSTGQELQPWLSQPYTPPTIGAGTPPSGGSTSSQAPVLIKPGAGTFTDAAGNVYSIDSSGNADENGQAMAGGGGTGAMELASGTVYAQDATSGTWYTWNQSTWTQATAAPPAVSSGSGGTTGAPPPPPSPSPDNTVVLASQAGASITDANSNVWTIVNGVVDENGTPAGTSANVTEIALEKGVIWQENSSKLWWSWNGTGWAGGAGTPTSPVPVPVNQPPSSVTVGTGPDSIVLEISEDAYANGDGTSDAAGDATFTVSVDGKQIGGTFTAQASHSAGLEQDFILNGNWAPGQHTVAVDFLNDAYGGTAATDRNLYVDDVTFDLTDTKQSATLLGDGAATFTVSKPITVVPDPLAVAGAGTVTDAAGNVYSVNSSGNAIENGQTMNGGGGTGAIEFASGTVYAQDGSSGTWYTWNQSTFTPAASPPPANSTTGPNPTVITMASTQTAAATITESEVSIVLSQGARLTFTGSNDVIQATSGTDTLTDHGTNNTFVLPSRGLGRDNISGNMMSNGDKFDFTTALKATAWDGKSSDLGVYIKVANDNAGGTLVQMSATAGGSFSTVADLKSVGSVSLSTLLAHSIT